MAVNDARKRAMARKVSARARRRACAARPSRVLGLTFKPNTDDMRDAPSIPLITALQDMGAKVRAYDPVGMEQAKPMVSNVTFCNDAYDCARGRLGAGDRHRMGAVPRARSRAAEER